MKDGKKLILCIDDDQDILESMSIILEGAGYAVETANSGEEGLRRYKAIDADFVIVDLMMEEVDAGTNFVKEVKALGGERPPIYMLSSVGDNLNMTADYASLGLAGVFQKPIDGENLLSILSTRLQ